MAAAVSGGADSVALLLALYELSQKERIALSAVHVHHGLRDSADGDEAFVKTLCAERNVPFLPMRVRLRDASENAAREARYQALAEGCARLGVSVLALAHHRRDQAETVLLHLFRGSGGDGLAGMDTLSTRVFPGLAGALTLWRPFLNVSPDTIRRALTLRGFSWREDETNAGDVYLRNYLRHQVLPTVTARIPKAEEAVCRAVAVLADENAYLHEEARRFLNAEGNASLSGPCRWVRYEPLMSLHPAIRRRVIRQSCPVELDWTATEGTLALHPGNAANLPRNWRAVCSREYLHFLPPEGEEISLQISKTDLFLLPWHGETGDGKRLQAMPIALFDQCALRFHQPGDRIRPLGAPGSKSMQDYWVDKKIPQPFRRYMPLLCLGNQVVWAIGAGPGEEARVTRESEAVLIRYDGFLPDGK